MKHLFIAILLLLSIGCSKSIDYPNARDLIDTNAGHSHRIPTPTTVTYTNKYTVSSDVLIYCSFPMFDFTKGNLQSWKLTINRKISGTLNITNLLPVKNDSLIAIRRYSLITSADTVFNEMPDETKVWVHNNLGANQEMDMPINVQIDDTIKSINQYNLVGRNSINLTIREVIDVFKPNCINSSVLNNDITVTLSYTYVANM